jgi:hypothetical protein
MTTLKILRIMTGATLAVVGPLMRPAVACTGGCDRTTGVFQRIANAVRRFANGRLARRCVGGLIRNG